MSTQRRHTACDPRVCSRPHPPTHPHARARAAFVYFNKGYYSDGFDLTVDVAKELKLTKATGCKVTVKTGAVSLACAALTLTAAPYSLETADYKIAAKLLLKGGTLAGSAPLRSAKVLLAP